MKVCSSCKKTKLEKNFKWRDKNHTKLQSFCRVCHNKYCRERYLKDIKKYREQNRLIGQKSRKKRKDIIISFLSTHSCVDCGNNDIRVLDFDHISGEKSFCISQAVSSHKSINLLLEEIKKCEIRCANCHRIKTYKQFGYGRLN